jgi:peptidoglycan hydrolase-like protein with peptidoglycan-binding domain
MFLASKIVWVGIAFTLVTTGVMVQGFRRSPSVSDSNKKGVAAFVIKNEIRKMQETLRDKGHYQGMVDGVFGLRTRASVRAYQEVENRPVTGQVDSQTADGLGVRPESSWGGSESAGREVGHGSDRAGYDTTQGKPSAYIKWTKGSAGTNKTLRKAVKTVAAPESGRGDPEKTTQAENVNRPQ